MGADSLQAPSYVVAHCFFTKGMDFGHAGVAVDVLG
jgi:hypothetical protein